MFLGKICQQLPSCPLLNFKITVRLQVMGQPQGFGGIFSLESCMRPWFGFCELKADVVLELRLVAFFSKQENMMNQNV